MEEEKDTDKAKEPTKEKDAGKKKEIKKPDASGEFLRVWDGLLIIIFRLDCLHQPKERWTTGCCCFKGV